MLPPNPQSNQPLTPEQISVVRESISAREKELDTIKADLLDEKSKFLAATASIAHLEPAISGARRTLAAQQTLLASLFQMKSAFRLSNRQEYPNWAEESTAKALCQSVTNQIDNQIKGAPDKLSDHIIGLEGNISGLIISIQTMEMEVYSKRLIQDTSIKHMNSTSRHRAAIEENINLLKQGLHDVRNIPTEMWVQIFVISVHDDMMEYIKRPLVLSIPSTSMKLSHVCRFWRAIIAAERNLSGFVTGYADGSWSRARLERFKHDTSFRSNAPIFAFRLTPPFWVKTPSSIRIKASDLQLPASYSLRISTSGNIGGFIPPLNFFPRPKSLTLYRHSGSQTSLDPLLAPIYQFTSLEIIDTSFTPPLMSGLSVTQRQLTRLKLDLSVGRFQPHDLTPHLGPNLIELHVIHTTYQAYSTITTSLSLPNLKVLGVMPPDTDFTHSFNLPALKKIILYGTTSKDPSTVISLLRFANAQPYQRVREFELKDWRPFDHYFQRNCNIMVLITDIIDRLRSIETLRCIDSVIDGTRLVELVKRLKTPSTNQGQSSLSTVVIECCSGITRDDCEAVSQLVTKMDVYV